MKISEIEIAEGPKDRAGNVLNKAKSGGFAPRSTDEMSPQAIAVGKALEFVEKGMDPREAASRVGIPYAILQPHIVKKSEDKYAQMAKSIGVPDVEASPKDIQGWTPTAKVNMISLAQAKNRLERLGFHPTEKNDRGSITLYVNDFKMTPILKGQVNWADIASKHPVSGHFSKRVGNKS